MFPLHSQTRRQLVLLSFAALCVLPTLGIAGWCAWQRTAWHARAEAVWIGNSLGMQASLDRIRHPRPDCTRYAGLALSDRESGLPVFSCSRLDVARGQAEPISEADSSGAVSASSAARLPAVLVDFQSAQCHTAACDEWIRVVEGLLTCRVGESWDELRSTGDRLEVIAQGRSCVLSDVRAALSRTAEKTVLSLEFRPEGAPAASRSRLVVVRGRKASSPAAQFELFCDKQAPLPCALLAWLSPALASGGEDSEFVGRLSGRQTPDGWRYELSEACLGNIELDRLLGDRLRPHRIAAIADVRIDRAAIAGGRLIAAEGAIGADHGRVNRSLVEACMACWGLEGNVPPGNVQPGNVQPGNVQPGNVQPGNGDLEIHRCQASYTLDDRGLELRALGANGKSLAFDSRGRPLLDEPAGGVAIPLASLLDVLAPRGETTAQDSPVRESLRRRLPLEPDRAIAERPPAKRR